jgi:hypothetical protein
LEPLYPSIGSGHDVKSDKPDSCRRTSGYSKDSVKEEQIPNAAIRMVLEKPASVPWSALLNPGLKGGVSSRRDDAGYFNTCLQARNPLILTHYISSHLAFHYALT